MKRKYKDLEPHPQLKRLKDMWNIREDILNKILWVSTNNHPELKESAIGMACEYIDFMSGCETSDPAEAWSTWCIVNKIEEQLDNNPYL